MPLVARPRWLLPRGYAHFDRAPRPETALRVATSPSLVARHSFWPLLAYQQIQPRYARDPSTGKRKRIDPKVREIRYAAHMDSHIYGYYAKNLGELLEAHYASPFGESVLAYRRFTPSRTNATFAFECFERIEDYGECDVIGLDVHDFFGSLLHSRLKAEWGWLLGEAGGLPADHWAVYKSVTSYAYIERDTLRVVLGREIPRRRQDANTRVCAPQEFRERVRPHVATNPLARGIPQGTAISAALANLYMLRCDRSLYASLAEHHALYRRYSDDILVICPPGSGPRVERLVQETLSSVGLAINEKKTLRVAFRRNATGIKGCVLTEDGVANEHVNRPLQYLGLQWDGGPIRIRPGTMAGYIARMVRAVHGAEAAADKRKMTRLYRRRLYRRFSHLGRSKRIFGERRPSARRERNFCNYAALAARETGSKAIKRQVGRLWSRLEREIARAEERLRAKHGPLLG